MAPCHQGSPVSQRTLSCAHLWESYCVRTSTAVVSDLLPSEKIGDLGQQIFEPPDLVFGEVWKLLPERHRESDALLAPGRVERLPQDRSPRERAADPHRPAAWS